MRSRRALGSGGLTFKTARKAGLFVIFWPIHLYQQLYAGFVGHCIKLRFAHGGVGVNVFLPERKAAGMFVVGGAAGDGGAEGGHELVVRVGGETPDSPGSGGCEPYRITLDAILANQLRHVAPAT